MTKRDPGRGQLRKRSARVWRDEENPTGPGITPDESEPETEAAITKPDLDEAEAKVDEPVNAGPGAGGATESAGRAKEHEGAHGGPSRKT